MENLAVAGLLHDVGKFDVKKRVLRTKHIYNEKEMDEMKKHPMFSYEDLQEIPTVSSVSRNAILFHHENLDGSGYYGMSAEKIGLFARILRIADTYDAFTARRKHRDAYAPAVAMEYIMSNVDTIFDKEVVGIFVRQFPFYPIGFTLELSNGEIAVVVSNAVNPMRPQVRLMNGTDVDLSSDDKYRSVLIKGML